jgi:hypothetical protein
MTTLRNADSENTKEATLFITDDIDPAGRALGGLVDRPTVP